MPAILLVLAGFILNKNPEWFNGADTVGTLMMIAGGAIFAFWLLFMVVMVWVVRD